MGLPTRSSCLIVVPLLLLIGAPFRLSPAPPAGRPLQSSATFRSRTDLVALDVSVEGQSGEPVPPLDASQFVVLEDDIPQDISFFAPEGRLPLAVVLLVDHSQSMAEERLARAKTATSAFLRALQPDEDGDDTRSHETFEDVSDGHNLSLPPAHELIQLAIDTGGEAIAVRRVSDLANVYEQIASALRQRYRLGYLSSSAAQDGRWHRISVRIPDMNVIARTRTGYYAPTARAPAGTPIVR
jgi:hypothetical protein